MSSGNERLYNWDDKAIRWYCNATEYRSFHSDVAQMILEKLPDHPSVCDVGCGTGALTMHLAPRCSEVLGIDLNPKPVTYLNSTIEEKHIGNVTTMVGDFTLIPVPDKRFDAAVFCLAGGVSTFLSAGSKWADRLFFVENATNSRSFSISGSLEKETYFNEDLNYLREMNIRHSYTFFSAPFGQVFTDAEDAKDFFKFYNHGRNDEEIEEALCTRLQKIDHPKYSYFLQNIKPLLLITVYCK